MRVFCTVMAILLFSATTASAGEANLAKNWKVTVYSPGQVLTPWLLKLDAKDGKLTGKLTTAEQFPVTEVKDIEFKDAKLTFVFTIEKQPFPFQFPVPRPGEKTLYGTVNVGRLLPAQLTVTEDTKV